MITVKHHVQKVQFEPSSQNIRTEPIAHWQLSATLK